MYKKWTEEEIFILKELYCSNGLSAIEICEKIKKRTYTSIALKIKRLKLKHTKEQIKQVKSRLNSGEKNGMYGKDSVNKGLNKENSNRIKNSAKKQSLTMRKKYRNGELDFSGEKNGMYGKDGWRKGQTKKNNKKVRDSAIKCSITKKRQWEEKTEEEKEKIRILWASQALKCKKKKTSIEIKVEDVLKKIGVNFEPQFRIGRWLIDYYIDKYKLAIECNGDYWHCNPKKYLFKNANKIQKKNMNRDKRKLIMLKEKNIQVQIFWEDDIHNRIENVEKTIRELLNDK